jgi:type IV secretory pathway TraG/TraD family ATPase VirD4
MAWGAAKAYGRTSRAVSESMQAAYEQHAAQSLPHRVRNRGYLAPGDPVPPPGLDMLDYSGLAPPGLLRATTLRSGGVTLAAAIDLGSGNPAWAYRLPLDRFFAHLAIVAPPGKGKTYGVIAPLAVRLLRAGASVVVLDVTGDLVNAIRDFGQASSTGLAVPFFHWSTDPSRGRNSWNPLAGLRPDDLTAVEGLKTSILGEEPADPRHRFFFDRELRILGALIRLLIAEASNPTLADLMALAVHRDVLRTRLAKPEHAGLRLELHDFLADEASAPQMIGELQTRLAPFIDAQVRTQVSRCDFTVGDVLDRPCLLVAGAELYLRQRGEIAASMLVNRLSAELARRYGTSSGVPVMMLLDEAPVLARRISLPSLLATARATRTGVVLAAQNVTQFGDEAQRSNVFDACDTMMILPGASEASVSVFQSRLGRREIRRRSVTREFGKGRGSVSTSGESADVLGSREIMQPPFGRFPALVHSRSDPVGAVAVELDRLTVNGFDR